MLEFLLGPSFGGFFRSGVGLETFPRFDGRLGAVDAFLDEAGSVLTSLWRRLPNFGGFLSLSLLLVVLPRFDGLLEAIDGFLGCEEAKDDSLPCLDGNFGGFFLGISVEDGAGEAGGRISALESCLRPAFDGLGVDLEDGVAGGAAALSFFGPSFGGGFLGVDIVAGG